MPPQCSEPLVFDAIGAKPVTLYFDGGDITSDAGLLIMAQANDKLGLTNAMAGELMEWRDPTRVTHQLNRLVKQRVYAIGAGYADCNDHDTLRCDPALKMACDQAPQSDGDLASQPTLSRFENQADARTLMKLGLAQGRCLIENLPAETRSVILDVDATDAPAHGSQQEVMFNGYYDEVCYCPLLLHLTAEDGEQLPLGALLRRGNAGATKGLRFMLRHAVEELRRRFPEIAITLRADGAYGCEKVLRLCKSLQIDYILGLPGNERLTKLSQSCRERAALCRRLAESGVFEDSRAYDDIFYQAHSWPERERVIVRSQIQQEQVDTRYVVTSLPKGNAPWVYNFYCGRGEQENRIKEWKLDLESGRTSCSNFAANQFRLLLHLAANMLWSVTRQALGVVAPGSNWARYQIGSLRERLVKVGARVTESCRRIVMQMASSYPWADIWRRLYVHLSPALG